jgi:hypothetical protein
MPNKHEHYDFYNKEANTAVLPIPPEINDLDHLMWQLGKLGVTILEEIKIPVDIPHRFYHVSLPHFLHMSPESEDEESTRAKVLDFLDEKGRMRLRIILSLPLMNVILSTRYVPYERMITNGSDSFVQAVYDMEQIGEDEEDFNDLEPIWQHSVKDSMPWNPDGLSIAKEWLDANYPDWQDPTAYWS